MRAHPGNQLKPPAALVLGGGVIGLSCAYELLKAGFLVEIRARAFGPQTTSGVAAALWHPFAVGPQKRTESWAHAAYHRFLELSHDPQSGVSIIDGREVIRPPYPDAWWTRLVAGSVHARREDNQADTLEHVAQLPVVQTPRYLPWLMQKCAFLGAHIVETEVSTLNANMSEFALAINCTGLGARALAGDTSLHPVRGQIVLVEQVGIEQYIWDTAHPRGLSYVIPRTDDIVLGGTLEPGSEELEPDDQTTQRILSRCMEIDPRLEGARVRSVRVGLRPARSAVRLEWDGAFSVPVIHNYGHGGAGVTLSWGCALEVAQMACAFVASRPAASHQSFSTGLP